jgi:hypothetical protein
MSMARPVMKRRERVRVEFGLSPELAAQIYDYADTEGLTLSQTGERLLAQALSGSRDSDPSREPVTPVDERNRRHA